jgi:ElaB/YqjD/DUF883 family membrane-anchored ribosome-binding protein
MINDSNPERSNTLVDHAAQAADDAIKSTQRLANNTLDHLSGSVQDARREVSPLLNRAADQTNALALRGLKVVRDTSQGLRDTAARASDSTVTYIKDEPLKAMLIAAATGAALMALIGLLGRSSQRG